MTKNQMETLEINNVVIGSKNVINSLNNILDIKKGLPQHAAQKDQSQNMEEKFRCIVDGLTELMVRSFPEMKQDVCPQIEGTQQMRTKVNGNKSMTCHQSVNTDYQKQENCGNHQEEKTAYWHRHGNKTTLISKRCQKTLDSSTDGNNFQP